MNTNARVTSKLRVWDRIDDQVYTLETIISVSDMSGVNHGTRTYHLEVRWNQHREAKNDPSETYRDKQSVS